MPSDEINRYNVYPDDFAAQMQVLKDWGYNPITLSMMVDVIKNGGQLPPHPIILTFDDGYQNNYEYAFPIMKEHGFVGVVYVSADPIDSKGYLTVEELKEMIEYGWEVGSHGTTHIDLTFNHQALNFEVKKSRAIISELLDYQISAFAYPFGRADRHVTTQVINVGYTSAVGIGQTWTHTERDLFYLRRIEVHGYWDLERFKSLLPWTSP